IRDRGRGRTVGNRICSAVAGGAIRTAADSAATGITAVLDRHHAADFVRLLCWHDFRHHPGVRHRFLAADDSVHLPCDRVGHLLGDTVRNLPRPGLAHHFASRVGNLAGFRLTDHAARAIGNAARLRFVHPAACADRNLLDDFLRDHAADLVGDFFHDPFRHQATDLNGTNLTYHLRLIGCAGHLAFDNLRTPYTVTGRESRTLNHADPRTTA